MEELQGTCQRCPTTSNIDKNRAIMNSNSTYTDLEKTSRPGIPSVPNLTRKKCELIF